MDMHLLSSIKNRFSRHWKVKFHHPLREAEFLDKHGARANTIKFQFHHAPSPADTNAEKMDYISELPDCILADILSMLSMKDMLNTCLLSKRLCNLWHLRRDLKFDQLNVLGSDEELRRAGYYVDVLKNGNQCEHLHLDVLRDEFVRRVDQFVKNFKGDIIDSIVVQFNLNLAESNIIDQWIRFAISKGAGRIDVLFLPRRCYSSSNCYKFPFGLFSESNNSALKHLHLLHCLVCHPENSDLFPFTNLRSLVLEESYVDQILITSLLSNCLLLKELSLFSCTFKSSTLKIVSSSLCHLNLKGCRFARETWPFLSLDCLKLTSFEFDMFSLRKRISINAPLLKSIYYASYLRLIPNSIARFPTLPQLEILTLHVCDSPQANISLKDTSALENIRQLNLSLYMAHLNEDSKIHIGWILTILQACPVLQKLSVMFISPKFFTEHRDIQDHGMSYHNEIKVVEMRGCVGNWYEIELAKNILKYTNKLEQIVLSPYWKDGDMHGWKSHPKWFQNGRERTREKLSQEVGWAEVIRI